MKIVIIVVMLLCCGSVFAFDKCPAIAIEDWLRNQGKFEGASICTEQQPDGSYKITKWVCDVPQPIDRDMEVIITDYEKKPKKKTDVEILQEKVAALEEKIK